MSDAAAGTEEGRGRPPRVPAPSPAPAASAGRLPLGVDGPAALAARLAEAGYLADEGLATAAFLTLALRRPLLLEGDAGVGKTATAAALAEVLDAPLLRLQCYEGIDATQALYDWNFPAQVLHLRTAEAAARRSGRDADPRDERALEAELYDRRFLVARPLLQALETDPVVLLVDEVDRADDEFEALLLEVLGDFTVSVPELGTIRAAVPPVVVLTSNRTREVSDALKRRCYYHWLDHPSYPREVAIVRTRLPGVTERLAREVVSAVQTLRGQDLLKPPGVAETLDWTAALVALGADALDADRVVATLGAVCKFREDQDRARAIDVATLVGRAVTDG
ncbi:AAA family ATPase [Egicoccus halophilus]|uniref:MoxR-like ATPase n=1 Tax=Egicoccus halophilus TaxID=1670830 RepID=A0A8J3ET83_9ACTN|nr:MoxR family ATPase [Egicoccus halophilus]GGI03405.1 MoxR-like ATPase [Egicoccus halophilus]